MTNGFDTPAISRVRADVAHALREVASLPSNRPRQAVRESAERLGVNVGLSHIEGRPEEVAGKLLSLLDLHGLCHTLERTPNTANAARKVLVDAIDAWLGREFPRDERQRLLVVSGCDLLARYRVPLSHFIHLASESRMIVFVVPGGDSRYKLSKPLPYLRPPATGRHVGLLQAVSIDSAPTCAECWRAMTFTPPAEPVEVFRRDLETALADQQRRLASEAIRRVRERGKGDALSQFVQAAQAANLAALVDLLDENIVKVIRKLLAEEQIGVAESDVIGKFLRQYGSLEEADIPAAVKAFEALLREAFQEAKRTHKDKKTIRLTLK